MGVETWAETCATLQMTPQLSLFICGNAGASLEVHGRLQHWRTPYPCIVTMGERASKARQQQGGACPQNDDDENVAALGAGESSRTRGPV